MKPNLEEDIIALDYRLAVLESAAYGRRLLEIKKLCVNIVERLEALERKLNQ